MTLLIILFGALTLLAGIIILIYPELILGFLKKNMDKITLHAAAVGSRLILGALLLYQSNGSRFPSTIEFIGGLSIAAAIFLALMGRSNFKNLMTWALSLSSPFGRIGGVIAMAFGAFLIYAFI